MPRDRRRTPDGSRTADYDYDLPEGRIARHPAERRDGSRLLLVDRAEDRLDHLDFPDIVDQFEPGDLIVVNESRVLPARLRGRRATGGRVEVLLLSPDDQAADDDASYDAAADDRSGRAPAEGRQQWTALLKPGRKLRAGERLTIQADGSEDHLPVEVVDEPHAEGVRRVCFDAGVDVVAALATFGELPLPPYLERDEEPGDRERYQTVYARVPGSVAAPTAGLHFTDDILSALEARGVQRTAVTLHVGAGTFRPVDVDDPTQHLMHTEVYEVPEAAAEAIAACRARGGAVWAVGTTVVRTLESVAGPDGTVRQGSGTTRLFLHPPKRLSVVDGLLTNFHLPRSTLMMLVACVAGYERTMRAYRAAVDEGYRFYSYGDAMLIPPIRPAPR